MRKIAASGEDRKEERILLEGSATAGLRRAGRSRVVGCERC